MATPLQTASMRTILDAEIIQRAATIQLEALADKIKKKSNEAKSANDTKKKELNLEVMGLFTESQKVKKTAEDAQIELAPAIVIAQSAIASLSPIEQKTLRIELLTDMKNDPIARDMLDLETRSMYGLETTGDEMVGSNNSPRKSETKKLYQDTSSNIGSPSPTRIGWNRKQSSGNKLNEKTNLLDTPTKSSSSSLPRPGFSSSSVN